MSTIKIKLITYIYIINIVFQEGVTKEESYQAELSRIAAMEKIREVSGSVSWFDNESEKISITLVFDMRELDLKDVKGTTYDLSPLIEIVLGYGVDDYYTLSKKTLGKTCSPTE